MPFDKVEKAKHRFMADMREGKEPGAPRTDANRAALEDAKKEFAKEVEKGKVRISRATAKGKEKIVEATAEGQRQIADATERSIRKLRSLSTASSPNAHAWAGAELEGASPEETGAQTEAANQPGGKSKEEEEEPKQRPKRRRSRRTRTAYF